MFVQIKIFDKVSIIVFIAHWLTTGTQKIHMTRSGLATGLLQIYLYPPTPPFTATIWTSRPRWYKQQLPQTQITP